MATISVYLSEKDVCDALQHWAVTRVLNQGQATSCELSITVDEQRVGGAVATATVAVETGTQSRPLPSHITPTERQGKSSKNDT